MSRKKRGHRRSSVAELRRKIVILQRKLGGGNATDAFISSRICCIVRALEKKLLQDVDVNVDVNSCDDGNRFDLDGADAIGVFLDDGDTVGVGSAIGHDVTSPDYVPQGRENITPVLAPCVGAGVVVDGHGDTVGVGFP